MLEGRRYNFEIWDYKLRLIILITTIPEFNVSLRANPCKVENFDNQKLIMKSK